MASSVKSIKDQIKLRVKGMSDDWETWRSHVQEIQENLMPWHGRGLQGRTETEMNRGDKKRESIVDAVPEDALGVLTAGMQSGLTNPARPWFKLSLDDAELAKFHTVRLWLDEVQKRMFRVFASSNLYRSLPHCYTELGGFGTAAMTVVENFNNVIHTRPYTFGEYMMSMDGLLNVDTLYREMYMTSKGMVELFGEDKVSDHVKREFKAGKTESRFLVSNIVEPVDDRYKVSIPDEYPVRSIYYEEGSEDHKLLEVRGFHEFPAMCPRWSVVSADVYGNSPGMKSLADIKMLYKEREKYLIALAKAVEPPLIGPGNLKGDQINTFAGGVTSEGKSGATGSQLGYRALYQVNVDLGALATEIQVLQAAIRRGLFNDLFLMLSTLAPNDKRTATEIALRHEEKLLMLGPVLERLYTELLDKLIDRTYMIMLRGGAIPEPPPEIQGMDYKVEYVSILARAQKMVGVTSIRGFLSDLGAIASVKEGALDKLDEDKLVDVLADSYDIPPSIIRNDDDVAAIRGERAKQQQAAQALQMAQGAAEGAKTLSQADTGSNNALTALMGQVQQ